MNILVIDGQGGQIGARLISALSGQTEGHTVVAVGEDVNQNLKEEGTQAMIKAGAARGATGENPAVVLSARADIIAGPLGIIAANALLGEITPKIAMAVSESRAEKVLIPVNRCGIQIAGASHQSMKSDILDAARIITELISR